MITFAKLKQKKPLNETGIGSLSGNENYHLASWQNQLARVID
ncbi:hypothetical protein [Persicirhabdus sediminis]|nr:hypothetical protein [Persicirhabdus sediminis]